MLQLRKGRPTPIAVPLGGGAVAMVRPATSFETDLAIAGAAQLLAGLIASQESAAIAVDVLGDEFASADFTKKDWLDAAAQRIAMLELATLCIESWTGVVDENQRIIEQPSRETIALLLRSTETAQRIGTAIRRDVNEEIAEGNVFAASPTGVAAVELPTAQAAGR